MTVRVVAAVVSALALVAVAAPAVDHARERRAAASVEATVEDTADAVRALARHSDPGDRIETAPRRTVHVSLPEATTLAAERGPPRLVARAGNGAETVERLPVEVSVCGDGTTLRGDTTFAYIATDGEPVVVALRGFIRGDGSRAAYACTTGPRPSDARPGLRL
ncbi:DUF7311 family protein [Halobacterium jilantaiense]|uniref:DUF7311 domain-containing protein n=1 Tax=Halobacterium jilantaiense TaxID=355548 RepID=A0A1I0NZH7_9EURY|nr:hypothetical protein [Halobacterium jilantaiense]SEW07296.1 hypothetical protein SAMN04487945_1275 [Halobacterium jilantaiense]